MFVQRMMRFLSRPTEGNFMKRIVLSVLLLAAAFIFVHSAMAENTGHRIDGRKLFASRAEAFGLPTGQIKVSHVGGALSVSRKTEHGDEMFVVTQTASSDGKIEFSAVTTVQGSLIEGITGSISMLPNGNPKIEYNVSLSSGGFEAGAMTVMTGGPGGPTVILPQTCDCTDGIDLSCTTAKCNAGDDCSAVNQKKCKWLVGTPVYTPNKVTWPPQIPDLPNYGYPFYICTMQ